jgi:hypothetical protein
MLLRLRQGQGASCCCGASFFFRRVNIKFYYGAAITWSYSAQMYSRLICVFCLLASEEIRPIDSLLLLVFFALRVIFFRATRCAFREQYLILIKYRVLLELSAQ